VTANVVIGLKYSDLVLFVEMISSDIAGDTCTNNGYFHIVLFTFYLFF